LAVIQQLRAKALGVFALLLSAGLTGGCATTYADEVPNALDAQAEFAIFVAREAKRKSLGAQDCPERYICSGTRFEITFEPIEWVAGNSGMQARTFEVVQGSNVLDDLTWLIHARRDDGGQWQIVSRDVVMLEACLDTRAGEDADHLNRTSSDWFFEPTSEDQPVCFGKVFRP
jgi:hypothetical protein